MLCNHLVSNKTWTQMIDTHFILLRVQKEMQYHVLFEAFYKFRTDLFAFTLFVVSEKYKSVFMFTKANLLPEK